MESDTATPENNHLQRNYVAFISYRHSDNKKEGRQWASWLHHSLETYEVPEDLIGTKNLRNEIIPERLYPVFRDEEELPADAHLSNPIVRALQKSRFLVVLCSPGAVASQFVEDEIIQFKSMGKTDQIIGAIISGEPNSSSESPECFPRPFRFEVEADGTISDRPTEPLAADFRLSDGSEGWTNPEAYRQALTAQSTPKDEIDQKVAQQRERLDLMKLKIIAGILGVPLGVLSERDKAYQLAKARKSARTLRKWLGLTTLLSIGVAFAGILAWKNQRKAEARKVEVTQTLAASDFQQGSGLLEQLESTPQGMALLARSLRDGGDLRAGIRLWTLLQQRSFWIPISSGSALTKARPVETDPNQSLSQSLLDQFKEVELDGEMVSPKQIVASKNGKRVVTIAGDTIDGVDVRLRIWDSSGTALGDWFAPDYAGMHYLYDLKAKISPDGKFLAILAQPWREPQYIEIRELGSGKAIGQAITASGRGPHHQSASFSRFEFITPGPNSVHQADQFLLTASTKGDAAIYSIVEEYDEVYSLASNQHATSIVTAEIDPAHQWLMSSSSDGVVQVTETTDGNLLGDLISLEHPAASLERSGESILTVTLASGPIRQYQLQPAHRVSLPDNLDLSTNPEAHSFKWAVDPENPPPDRLVGTDPESGLQLIRLNDRQIGLRQSNSQEVGTSPTFGTDLDIVGFSRSGQYITTTTIDFTTEIWDQSFSRRLGPPFQESPFFGPGKTPQETNWVTLLPKDTFALLESFFWDPPNLARHWYCLWDIPTGQLLMDRTPVTNDGGDRQVDAVRLDNSGNYIVFLTRSGNNQAASFTPLSGIQIYPPKKVITWLPDLAEALSDIRYNRQGNPEPVPNRQQQLERLLPLLKEASMSP